MTKSLHRHYRRFRENDWRDGSSYVDEYVLINLYLLPICFVAPCRTTKHRDTRWVCRIRLNQGHALSDGVDAFVVQAYVDQKMYSSTRTADKQCSGNPPSTNDLVPLVHYYCYCSGNGRWLTETRGSHRHKSQANQQDFLAPPVILQGGLKVKPYRLIQTNRIRPGK